MGLNSLKEKNAYFAKHDALEKWLYVEELVRLAQQLPRYWSLTTNRLGNLTIMRTIEVNGEEHQELLGHINFAESEIDLFNATGNMPKPPFPNERPNEIIWKEIKDPENDIPPWDEDGIDEDGYASSKMCFVFVPLENRQKGLYYPYYMAELISNNGKLYWQEMEDGIIPFDAVTHYSELHFYR